MVIFIHSKTKKMLWNFRGQNHEISKIRDNHLVKLVILRLTCVLYAFPFNSLPFMDSQTIATFGSKTACSDVTKTLIAPKFSVRYFWNFVRRWSIQFVTATRSLARVITRRKKWGRLTPPPPSKSRVNTLALFRYKDVKFKVYVGPRQEPRRGPRTIAPPPPWLRHCVW